jgi:hypothetical protein
MKRLLRTLLVGTLAIATAATSLAQGLPSAPYLTLREKSAFLLANRQVSEKLNITARQQTMLDRAITSRSGAEDAALKLANAPEERFRQIDREFAKEALAPLTDGQRTALFHAAIREEGPMALGDAEVQKMLGLTAGQITSVQTLVRQQLKAQEDYDAALGEAIEKLPLPQNKAQEAEYDKQVTAIVRSFEAQLATLNRREAETNRRLVAVLNPTQKARWDAIQKG